ncbi:MAG: T9SS type A sorting domain-containing protein [Ignavibacteriales bacterium]|nr:T9SS type A sorting domain-containing protein [Ignavibacteriales bacterium]
MKSKLLFFCLFFLAVNIFGQTYPEITIYDIQYIHPDTLMVPPYDYFSPYEDSTVIVTGILMNSPYRGANPDSSRMLHSAAPAALLQDVNNPEYGAVLMRFPPDGNTLFNVLDSGYVVKVTGTVQEYNITTQLNLTKFEAADVIGFQDRPAPVELTIEDFAQIGTNSPVYSAEKWEGVYVEIKNVTTTQAGVIGYRSFVIFNDNGTSMVVGSLSDYWRNSIPQVQNGTRLEYIRGTIETRNNIAGGYWFMINPMYPNDVKITHYPPSISNITRDKGTVGYNESVVISATITDFDGVIDSGQLFYKVNDGTFQKVEMTNSSGDIWDGTIPGQTDSCLISYFIKAVDDSGYTAMNPTDTTKNLYFYYVLNRSLTIQDVQRSPFGSGYSGYNGFDVTVSGVVTADTSDITSKVYIQNGTGPWSGIWLFGTEAINLSRGDSVSVTGLVYEDFYVTRIQDLDAPANITVHKTGATVPDASLVETSVISTYGGTDITKEQWESVLIRYDSLTVTDENADGNPGPEEGSGGNRNYGEILVADISGIGTRVELQDGNSDYHNFWNPGMDTIPIYVTVDDKFSSMQGIIYYSYSNYKLIPRKNDDFQGFTPVGINFEVQDNLPNDYALSQNYPNPFNPATVIEYNIPEAGNVSIKIFNILGQEIATLMNTFQNAGKYKVSFTANNLASGVYFYRIEANNYVAVKKMILMK